MMPKPVWVEDEDAPSDSESSHINTQEIVGSTATAEERIDLIPESSNEEMHTEDRGTQVDAKKDLLDMAAVTVSRKRSLMTLWSRRIRAKRASKSKKR